MLEKRVEKVCEEEKDKRKDLYIKARSYQGKLSLCKPRMMKEENFHLVSTRTYFLTAGRTRQLFNVAQATTC